MLGSLLLFIFKMTVGSSVSFKGNQWKVFCWFVLIMNSYLMCFNTLQLSSLLLLLFHQMDFYFSIRCTFKFKVCWKFISPYEFCNICQGQKWFLGYIYSSLGAPRWDDVLIAWRVRTVCREAQLLPIRKSWWRELLCAMNGKFSRTGVWASSSNYPHDAHGFRSLDRITLV